MASKFIRITVITVLAVSASLMAFADAPMVINVSNVPGYDHGAHRRPLMITNAPNALSCVRDLLSQIYLAMVPGSVVDATFGFSSTVSNVRISRSGDIRRESSVTATIDRVTNEYNFELRNVRNEIFSGWALVLIRTDSTTAGAETFSCEFKREGNAPICSTRRRFSLVIQASSGSPSLHGETLSSVDPMCYR